MPNTFGKITDVNFHVSELNLFKNQVELSDKAHILNSLIQDGKDLYKNSGFATLYDSILGKGGIPLAPFPNVEACLGLTAKDSSMEIKDGYAVMAFDYHVDGADNDCIFDMKNTASSKENRMMKGLMKKFKNKSLLTKYKDTIKKVQSDFAKGLEGEIPDLPFKVPEFDVAGIKINLNDKEQVGMVVNATRDFLKGD